MRSTFAVILISCLLAGAYTLSAQSPEKFNYQAVARDASGNVLVSQAVSLRISILQGTLDGTAVYVETHATTTNAHGQLTVAIGGGTPVSGTFSTIGWGGSNHFLKTEMDAAGGTSYALMGTTQLLSVPYALYAKSSGSGISLADTDGDTKIQVEETSDEDVIRFDVGGSQKWIMQGNRLEPSGSGESVFIGKNAGFSQPNDKHSVFVGFEAGRLNYSGLWNTAVGYASLYSNVDGHHNTAIGNHALRESNANYNTALGSDALRQNTTGGNNTAVGESALHYNTSGNYNTALGSNALRQNTTGWENTAIGLGALYSNLANSRSTAVGFEAMYAANNTTSVAVENVAIGYRALYGSSDAANNTGRRNSAIGTESLKSVTSGTDNAGLGHQSAFSNTSGWENTVIGNYALYSNTTNSRNTAIGFKALFNFDNAGGIGTNNTALGYFAGYGVEGSTGVNNIFLGFKAGDNVSIGSNNIVLGYDVDLPSATANSQMVLGNAATFYGDLSNDRIGIGTTSPTQKVEIFNGNLLLSNNANAGEVRLAEPNGSNFTAFKAQAQISDITYSLPASAGTNGQVLSTDATGILSWISSPAVNLIIDSDNDTKVQVEETTDEDMIRFDVAGTEKLMVNHRGLVLPSTTDSLIGVIYKGTAPFIHNYASSQTAGQNTFVGINAGNFTMSGSFNEASHNTAIGRSALSSNTSGTSNTAIGSIALVSNTSGFYNTAVGESALHYNTSGNYNTALGSDALRQNTTGWENTAIGVGALYSNLANSRSTAVGFEAMYAANNTTSSAVNSIALGYRALYGSSDAANNTGKNNSAIGTESLKSITSGSENAGFGLQSAYSNTSGWENTAIGNYALYSNTTNSRNTAIGFKALFNFDNTGGIGTNNTALGYFAGYGVEGSTGVNNIFLGFKAGDNVSTGSNNIVLGYDVDLPSATANSQMVLGNAATFYGDLSNNRIGVGTTSPTQKVEIFNGNLLLSNNANAGEVRLAEPNGSNFTAFKAQAQISDITYSLPASAGTNGQVLSTDATGVLSWISPTSGTVTGTGVSTRIAFWNTSTELTSNSNLFWDNTNNRLGIGTITPHAALQIGNGTNNRKIVLHEDANNDHQYFGFGINTAAMRYQVAGTNSDHIFYAATSSAASNELARIKGNGELKVSSLSTNGPVYSFNAILTNTNPSDRNLKENIVPIGNSMDKVMALNPVTYTWKSNGAKGIGFIAQEVEAVIPELVNTNDDGTKGIYSLEMIPFLVKAIQEQQQIIEQQKNENDKQSATIEGQMKVSDLQQKLIEELLLRLENLENK